MIKIHSALVILILLIFTHAGNSLALHKYLSMTVPKIIEQLNNNMDELIAQRKTIDITKLALDKLVNKQEITEEQAAEAKQNLEDTFQTNFKQSSSYQRAIYNTKRPFQFVYNKITDSNASYLERFAYSSAAAIGVAIAGYTIYRGGKYAYSALQDWQKEMNQQSSASPVSPLSVPDILTHEVPTLSEKEIRQRLTNIDIPTDIQDDIVARLANRKTSPLGTSMIVLYALDNHARGIRPDRRFTILWKDTEIIYNLLKMFGSNPDITDEDMKALFNLIKNQDTARTQQAFKP